MYLLKYRGKLLFHREICDYQSHISIKKLDIKKDKSLVKRLFGRLRIRRSSALKAERIRCILTAILDGQRTLPEILHGAVNRALTFIRRGLFKVHRKTNTSIDYPGIELPPDLERLYSLQGFNDRLEDLFRVLEVSGFLEKAGIPREDIPFFKAHAAMIKRGRGKFAELYSELEENPRLARQCGFSGYGYIPSDRSFERFRSRALPQLYTLRDLLVKRLHGMNALSFRVAAIDGKFKRSNTYAYPGRDGYYSDRDAGLCNKGTYKRGPGFMDLKLVDVASEQPLCSMMFAGNEHETRFLKPLLNEFHMRYGCYPRFLLGDKAFFSFENVLYCLIRGIIPILDSKKVKTEELIAVEPNHNYRKCYLGNFNTHVLGRWPGSARPAKDIIHGRKTTPKDGCQQEVLRKQGSGQSWPK